MTDLFFSYNTGGYGFETKVQFLYNHQKEHWSIHIDNEETQFTLTINEDDEDGLYYELYKKFDINTSCIKTFNFDGQTVRYLPNLMKVYMVILDNLR